MKRNNIHILSQLIDLKATGSLQVKESEVWLGGIHDLNLPLKYIMLNVALHYNQFFNPAIVRLYCYSFVLVCKPIFKVAQQYVSL